MANYVKTMGKLIIFSTIMLYPTQNNGCSFGTAVVDIIS